MTAAAEIAHVLFMDIIGYSTMPTSAQSRIIQRLNTLVAGCQSYRTALDAESVLALPTGDGMALIFSEDVTAPASCAVELWPQVQGIPLRMGIHSGLVQKQVDLTGKPNVAGEGINTAQRVMDFAEGGQILLSEQYARWLSQFPKWRSHVREVGEGTAKHGLKLKLCNLVSPEFGNPTVPARLTPVVQTRDVLIIYRQPDEAHATSLAEQLRAAGHRVSLDGEAKIGATWVEAAAERIRAAEVVVPIVSEASSMSETFEFQIETALEEGRTRPLKILPFSIGGSTLDQLSGLPSATSPDQLLARLR